MRHRRRALFVAVLGALGLAGPASGEASAASFNFTASFTQLLQSRDYSAGSGGHTFRFRCTEASAGQTYTVNLYKDQFFGDIWEASADRTCRAGVTNRVDFTSNFPAGTYYFKLVKLPNGRRIEGSGSMTYPAQ